MQPVLPITFGSRLQVVPSLHHRMVFAEAVVAGCRRSRFDVIAVELPRAYESPAVVDGIRRVLPHTGLLVVGAEKPAGGGTVAVDARECGSAAEDLRRFAGGPHVPAGLLPVSPCDSIVAAVRAPVLCAGSWPDWTPHVAFVDEAIPGGSRAARFDWLDDEEARGRGLDAFYARWEDRFQEGRCDRDVAREEHMARRLAWFLREGRSVLFVCGAAHWRGVRDLLDRVEPEPPGPPSFPSVRVLRVLPSDAWAAGWLDDGPHVTGQFERWLAAPTRPAFDKAAAVASVVAEAALGGVAAGLPVSPRRLGIARRYADLLTRGSGRALPTLADGLIHPAEACVSPEFGELLRRVALSYPWQHPTDPAEADAVPRPVPVYGPERDTDEPRTSDLIPAWVWERAPMVDEETLAVPDVLVEVPGLVAGSGDRLAERPAFAAGLTGPSGMMQDPLEEGRLAARLCNRARELAHRPAEPPVARRFTGDLGRGIDWRATVRARARGEDGFRIRPSCAVRHAHRCDGLCPVVWVFGTAEPTSRFSALLLDPDDGYREVGYTSFYWATATRRLARGQIKESRLAVTLNLLRGNMPFTDQPKEAILEAYRRLLARLPPARRCTVAPWNDPDLTGFLAWEQAVACAAKCAADHVVVVSIPDVTFGPRLRAFAAARGVKLIRVNREHFDRRHLDRLSVTYDVPCPSATEPPYPFYRRFVPPAE